MTNRTIAARRFRSLAAAAATLCVALSSVASISAASPPTPAAAATPNADQPRAAAETSATVVDDAGAETLLGKPVRSVKGEDLGQVVDVVIDRSGRLLAAIIDFGGFLGVGTRKIAVNWRILHFPPNGALDKLIVDLPRDRLRDAPIYKAGEPIVIIGALTWPPAATPAPAATPSATNSPKPQP